MTLLPQTNFLERAAYFRVSKAKISRWVAEGVNVNDSLQVAWKLVTERAGNERSVESLLAELDAGLDADAIKENF